MKKAVFFVAALVLIASIAFAQDAGVKIGGWGRGIFTAVAIADNDPVTQTQVSWGGAPRIGINIIGTSANVGFQIDLVADGDMADVRGDQQKIWVKPIDMVTVQIGRAFDDALRGSASYGSWNWLRPNGIWGDDAVFLRVCDLGAPWMATNFEVAIDPMEGVHAYAAFSGIMGTGPLTEDVFKNGQYGAGYTIPSIGLIRAQYLGYGDYGVINAAFKLTAVPGLMVDLGAFIPTDSDMGDMTFSFFASYAAMGTLTIFATGAVQVPTSGDMGFGAGIGCEYGLEGGLAINADFRYNNDVMSAPDGMIAGLLSIQKNFSNGLIGVGVELSNTGFGAVSPVVTEAGTFVIAVPVRLEYWF